MTLGSWSADIDWDPSLDELIYDGSHMRFSQGQEPIYTGVITKKRPGGKTRAIGVSGRSLAYWLGLDDDGSVIIFRDYVAGTNKLSNGSFELAELFWVFGENTGWRLITSSSAYDGSVYAAAYYNLTDVDDVLRCTEDWECLPGANYVAGCWARGLGGIGGLGLPGRLRSRLVFDGTFDTPDLANNPTWLGWSQPGGISVSGTDLRLGPIPQHQVFVNADFGSGLTNWYESSTDSDPHDVWTSDAGTGLNGTDCARTAGWSTAGRPGPELIKYLRADSLAGGGVNTYPVEPGEIYQAEAWFKSAPGSEGSAYISLMTPHPSVPGHDQWFLSREIDAASDLKWYRVSIDNVTIPDDRFEINALAEVHNHGLGYWYVDSFTLTRIRGNTAVSQGPAVGATSERTYRWTVVYSSGPTFQSGSVRLKVGCGSYSARVPVGFESQSLEAAGASLTTIHLDVKVPSGYDYMIPELTGYDLLGDAITVHSLTCVDLDPNTKVYDDFIGPRAAVTGPYREMAALAPAPAGAERVRMELVAESSSGPWEVDAAFIRRVDAPLSTGASIVRGLLRHAQTGLPLLTEGVITDDEPLMYDWAARNLTNRQALETLSRTGLLAHPHEWRVNADGTLDWAFEVGDDRTDVVLHDTSFEVLSAPDVERSWEQRLTNVEVVGADRTYPFSTKYTVTGSASRPSTGLDFMRNPIVRTRVIEDSTIDHIDWANARAQMELDQSAAEFDTIDIALSDDRALVPVRVGDWLYLWQPTSGIEDLARPSVLLPDGRSVHPQRERVLQRDWSLGGGFRAELLLTDGSWLDITSSVQWSESTSARLQVGTIRPDLTSYLAGNPFLRARASAPR